MNKQMNQWRKVIINQITMAKKAELINCEWHTGRCRRTHTPTQTHTTPKTTVMWHPLGKSTALQNLSKVKDTWCLKPPPPHPKKISQWRRSKKNLLWRVPFLFFFFQSLINVFIAIYKSTVLVSHAKVAFHKCSEAYIVTHTHPSCRKLLTAYKTTPCNLWRRTSGCWLVHVRRRHDECSSHSKVIP